MYLMKKHGEDEDKIKVHTKFINEYCRNGHYNKHDYLR